MIRAKKWMKTWPLNLSPSCMVCSSQDYQSRQGMKSSVMTSTSEISKGKNSKILFTLILIFNSQVFDPLFAFFSPKMGPRRDIGGSCVVKLHIEGLCLALFCSETFPILPIWEAMWGSEGWGYPWKQSRLSITGCGLRHVPWFLTCMMKMLSKRI